MLTGVVGWPVAHSLSPRLHGMWLRRYGIDGAYVPLAVRPGDVATALRGLAASGFRGVNVTVPHKLAAYDACDARDEPARRTGAVNTIVFEEGRLSGSNTDGAGFLRSLAEASVPPGPAVVLGAGGAARAIAAALLDAGAAVSIASRRPEAAEALAATLGGAGILAWDRVSDALADMALLVNATSAGMHENPPPSITLERASADLAVADIVYAPRETALLADARARGLRTVEGIGMLLHQAALGFQLWFGIEPAIDDALRADLLAPQPDPCAPSAPSASSAPGLLLAPCLLLD